MSDKDYSYEAMLGFLDYLAKKGLVKRKTTENWRGGVKNIIGDLDDNEKSDVSKVDLESAYQRFINKNSSKYSPSSLPIYKGRAKSAIDNFVSWVDDPSKYQPPESRMRKPRAEKQSQLQSNVINSNTSDNLPNTLAPITFPIPLRNGQGTIKIENLPSDLTSIEAGILKKVLQGMPDMIDAMINAIKAVEDVEDVEDVEEEDEGKDDN